MQRVSISPHCVVPGAQQVSVSIWGFSVAAQAAKNCFLRAVFPWLLGTLGKVLCGKGGCTAGSPDFSLGTMWGRWAQFTFYRPGNRDLGLCREETGVYKFQISCFFSSYHTSCPVEQLLSEWISRQLCKDHGQIDKNRQVNVPGSFKPSPFPWTPPLATKKGFKTSEQRGIEWGVLPDYDATRIERKSKKALLKPYPLVNYATHLMMILGSKRKSKRKLKLLRKQKKKKEHFILSTVKAVLGGYVLFFIKK